jgi:hypothetical protein
MAAYRVTKPVGAVGQSYGGSDGMVVFAENATDAKAIAKAQHAGGDSDSAWDGAVVTELVERTDLETFVFRILIEDGATIVSENIHTGIAADEIDELGDAMVILLNATAEIAAASYNDTTNVLTIAETTDAIGDHTATVTISKNGTEIPGLVGAVTDEGAGGAALSVQLATDAVAMPRVWDEVKFV